MCVYVCKFGQSLALDGVDSKHASHSSSIQYLSIYISTLYYKDRQTDRHQRYASIPPNSNHQTHSNAHVQTQQETERQSQLNHSAAPPFSPAPRAPEGSSSQTLCEPSARAREKHHLHDNPSPTDRATLGTPCRPRPR